MKEKHPNQALLWAYLVDQCEDKDVSTHIRDCPECRKNVELWREVFGDQKREMDREIESLPATYWQKLETETRSRLHSSAPSLRRRLYYAGIPVMVSLILAVLWIGRYYPGEGSITEEQLNLVAELSLNYEILPEEEDLFWETSRLIAQPSYGSLSILYPTDNHTAEADDSLPYSSPN
jgi:hypothetical protein